MSRIHAVSSPADSTAGRIPRTGWRVDACRVKEHEMRDAGTFRTNAALRFPGSPAGRVLAAIPEPGPP